MQDDLLIYYERELTYLRRLGAEFAARYPKVAARLQLEPTKSDDPHVERLLEGFAFLAARVHRRIDDDLPEVSEALLDVVHPQHVRPIPSLSLVEMELDPELGALPGGLHVPRGSELRSRPVQGMPCRFRTCYDTTLWPVTLTAAEWTTAERAAPGMRLGEAVGAIRVELRALTGLTLGGLEVAGTARADGARVAGTGGLDALRLHLDGDASVADLLYELLMNNCQAVVVRDPDQPNRAPVLLPAAVQPVGFAPDESLLPYPRRTFAGYALLQELFAFPRKFLFVDVAGVAGALRTLGAGPRAEIAFIISPFERAERRELLRVGLSPSSLRLGCTPIVNLFEHTADPLLLDERRTEYVVVPDTRRRLEIEAWSIESVATVTPGDQAPVPVEPLYGFRAGRSDSSRPLFWHSVRRPAGWRTDRGTELFLTFTDLAGGVRAPNSQVATIHLTCFNGELPSRLPFGADDRSDFELVKGGPVRRVVSLMRATPVIQPALGKPMLWRLISALSLNHLSLVEDGHEALREVLRLHNVGGSDAGEQQIQGLVGVRSEPAFARAPGDQGGGIAFARGRRVELTFDEEHFSGGGMFVMASVLERFLGLYASMNSFTQLAVHSRQRRRRVREWPPRAGVKALL